MILPSKSGFLTNFIFFFFSADFISKLMNQFTGMNIIIEKKNCCFNIKQESIIIKKYVQQDYRHFIYTTHTHTPLSHFHIFLQTFIFITKLAFQEYSLNTSMLYFAALLVRANKNGGLLYPILYTGHFFYHECSGL